MSGRDADAAAGDQTSATPPRRVTSAELMGGARRIEIEHAGELYTLRVTRQNKLLLTK